MQKVTQEQLATAFAFYGVQLPDQEEIKATLASHDMQLSSPIKQPRSIEAPKPRRAVGMARARLPVQLTQSGGSAKTPSSSWPSSQ